MLHRGRCSSQESSGIRSWHVHAMSSSHKQGLVQLAWRTPRGIYHVVEDCDGRALWHFRTVAQGWCRLFGCASHLVAPSNNASASCCLRYGSNRIKQQSLRCLFAACLCWRVWRLRLVYERGNNYIYNNIKRLCDIVQPAETFLLPWFADVDVAVELLRQNLHLFLMFTQSLLRLKCIWHNYNHVY